MFRLIETLCIQDGKIRNLEIHQERVNRSRWKLSGLSNELILSEFIINQLPNEFEGKCRIIYSEEWESIEFLPYQIRPVQSVRLVENNEVDYSHKFEDRNVFEQMKDSVTEDEIIIVKKGQITDTSYSNLVFFDGDNWITPRSFLLNGTMRQSLLKSKKIIEEEVNPKDLNRFHSFKLINAMMNLEESPGLDVSIIV